MGNNTQNQEFTNGSQVKMHEGEFDIDIALVKRLLTEQFPHFAERSITIIRSMGTVNAIYRLGDELYLRMPRLKEWAESIENEWVWLPKLAPYVSLHIPKPFARGTPTNYYPCPWAIYHWIDGSSYQDKFISDQHQVAYDLADFIKELRRMDSRGAPRGGRDPLIELDIETRLAIESSRHIVDAQIVSEAWALSLKALPWDQKPVWIHGDLLKSNLLIKDGRLCAVIDFGGVGIGDPAADVVPAWSVFNKAGRETFRRALQVDDNTWNRARGYALHQALMIIPYYQKTNPEFVTMAKRTVDEVLVDFQ